MDEGLPQSKVSQGFLVTFLTLCSSKDVQQQNAPNLNIYCSLLLNEPLHLLFKAPEALSESCGQISKLGTKTINQNQSCDDIFLCCQPGECELDKVALSWR